MKCYRALGDGLGNLTESPWINGGVSVAEMKQKARQGNTKSSHLWNEAYRDHDSRKGHKKAVELEKTQRTLCKYFRKPMEDAMKKRLRIAYHTTKQCQSKLYYKHAALLVKKLDVDIGSTQLGRDACAEMRKTFAGGIRKKQKKFFVTPEKYTNALPLVSGGADEVTRHNRQF